MKELEMYERQSAVNKELSSYEMAGILAEVKWITEEIPEVLKKDVINKEFHLEIMMSYIDKLIEVVQDVPGEECNVFGQSRIMRRKMMGDDFIQLSYNKEIIGE